MATTIVKMNQTKQTVQQLHVPIISSFARKVARTVHQNASLKYNFVMVSVINYVFFYRKNEFMKIIFMCFLSGKRDCEDGSDEETACCKLYFTMSFYHLYSRYNRRL